MAKLLFRLRNVPEDEADAIRSLLAEQGFETYETSSGIFQMSMPAIWLVQDSDFARARALIDQWQAQRVLEARANAAAQPALSVWQRVRRSPIRMTLLWVAIALVASLTTWPFWQFFVQFE
jgi:hypothetical protein